MTVKRVLYLLVLICGLDFSLEFEQEAGSFFNYQKNDLVMKVYEIFDESLRNSSSLFKVKLKNPLSDFQAINNRSNYADVHQAAVTILKLQDTYRFKSADLARGKFNKITIDAELSFKHCFLIGKVAYLQGYHKLAVEWLLEALKNSPENEELLDYLTFSLKELGNVKEAFKINDKLLKLNPQSKVALTRKSKYFLEMQAERNGVLQILRNKG